jgi:hypothetical protein
MSGSVRDGSGRVVASSRLERVGGYAEAYTAWAMIWTIVPLANRTHDVSEALNAQVQAARGEAVVNFTAVARPCASNIFTIVGVLPGCTDVELSGDIVRVRPEAGAAPSASAAPSGGGPALASLPSEER